MPAGLLEELLLFTFVKSQHASAAASHEEGKRLPDTVVLGELPALGYFTTPWQARSALTGKRMLKEQPQPGAPCESSEPTLPLAFSVTAYRPCSGQVSVVRANRPHHAKAPLHCISDCQ